MRAGLAAAMSLMMCAGAAVAQAPLPTPTAYGSSAMLAGRYDVAEAILAERVAADPAEPSALLNMAYLYARTGRETQARALYQRVLAEESVMLDVASGRAVASHDLARRGLQPSVQLSSR